LPGVPIHETRADSPVEYGPDKGEVVGQLPSAHDLAVGAPFAQIAAATTFGKKSSGLA
jgi:hypothetical protein